MLVLTRKIGEEIILKDKNNKDTVITITLVELRSGQVKIGIDAPKYFAINRKEVQDKIDRGDTRPLRKDTYPYEKDFEDLS